MASRKQRKQHSYINVPGIENSYLDACLLLHLDNEKIFISIADEKSLIAKSGLNTMKIMAKKGERADLIRRISPNVQNFYSFYNLLVHINMGALELLQRKLADDVKQYTDHEWKEKLYKAVQEEECPYYMYVNWLRFHEAYHGEIKAVLEMFGGEFQKETGLCLSEDYKIAPQVEKEVDSVEDAFDSAIRMLTNLKETIGKENYKEQYEKAEEARVQLAEEVQQLNVQLKKANDQVKAKEQQLSNKDKEQSQLKRKLEAESRLLEQKNKDLGKLSGDLGSLRKEAEQLRKQNTQFEREVSGYQKNREAALSSLEERLQNQFRTERSLLIDKYERQIEQVTAENEALSRQAEEYVQLQQKIDQLETENERLSKEIHLYMEQLAQKDKSHEQELEKLRVEVSRQAAAAVQLEAGAASSVGDAEAVDEFKEFGDFLDSIGKNDPIPL